MSSATWLQIHGLEAKKLTLMDALLVTAVPHSPTYVPILDKLVLSKVFDEVIGLSLPEGFILLSAQMKNNPFRSLVQL